jgi:putative MATE family efflux protein
LFYTAFALAKGVGVGTTVLLSHSLGQGNQLESRQIVRAALPLIMLVLLPWIALTHRGLSTEVLWLLGGTSEVQTEGAQYLFWLVLSFVPMGYFLVAEAVCMSHGDSITPMKSALLGNAVSIVLKYFLILHAGMGVAGSSLGTCLGWLLAASSLGFRLVVQGKPRPQLALNRDLLPRWLAIAGWGSQTSLAVLIAPLGLGFINLILARMDLAGVAALNLIIRLEFMVTVPLVGLSNAMVPFMGYNLGQKNIQRIRQGVAAAIRLGESIIVPVMILFLLFPEPLLWVFQPAPEVLSLASYGLRCTALGYLVVPLELTLQGAAQGLKKTWYALVILATRHLALRVPLVALLSTTHGIQGVFWSLPLSLWISGAVSLILLRLLLIVTERTGKNRCCS